MASQITSLNRLFWRKSKKISKLRVTGLFAGISPVTGEFPAQMNSNAENVSIWWCHLVYIQRVRVTKGNDRIAFRNNFDTFNTHEWLSVSNSFSIPRRCCHHRPNFILSHWLNDRRVAESVTKNCYCFTGDPQLKYRWFDESLSDSSHSI